MKIADADITQTAQQVKLGSETNVTCLRQPYTDFTWYTLDDTGIVDWHNPNPNPGIV